MMPYHITRIIITPYLVMFAADKVVGVGQRTAVAAHLLAHVGRATLARKVARHGVILGEGAAGGGQTGKAAARIQAGDEVCVCVVGGGDECRSHPGVCVGGGAVGVGKGGHEMCMTLGPHLGLSRCLGPGHAFHFTPLRTLNE